VASRDRLSDDLPMTTHVSVGLTALRIGCTTTSVQLGNVCLDEIPTGIHRQEIFSGEQGLLGNELLSRFKLTVDAINGRVILER
jgi:predicted aspartyl protease